MLRRVAKATAATVAAWLALWGFFVLSDGRVQPGLLAAAVAGVAVIIWAATWLASAATPIDWAPAYVSDLRRTPHDPRFSRLSRLLSEASDRIAVGDEVRRTLTSLADERLRRLHGVDRGSDPERARALLGDELYRYVTEPSRRTRGNEAASLSRFLTRIEDL